MIKNFISKLLKQKKLILTSDMQGLTRKRRIAIPAWDDYVRISTLELVADEIYNTKIKGAVAELGVYKGDFAKYINEAFPDRKLYLFDTFQGFNKKDTEFDIKNQYTIDFGDFSQTNIDLVLNKMPFKKKCFIKKGYFPESLGSLEERFCFVSIDADLYQPTYEGLKYFYPRLNKGGYIFIHDYVRGVKAAVHDFSQKEKISYVPMSDNWVSVIICKS